MYRGSVSQVGTQTLWTFALPRAISNYIFWFIDILGSNKFLSIYLTSNCLRTYRQTGHREFISEVRISGQLCEKREDRSIGVEEISQHAELTVVWAGDAPQTPAWLTAKAKDALQQHRHYGMDLLYTQRVVYKYLLMSLLYLNHRAKQLIPFWDEDIYVQISYKY